MIKPWNERAGRPSAGIPMARERVTTVFQGFAGLTGEGWPNWAAQRLIEDYPVFDTPEEYTYENLIHYVMVHLGNNTSGPDFGKNLEDIDPPKYGNEENWDDPLFDILYRLLADPLIFLSANQEQASSRKKTNK